MQFRAKYVRILAYSTIYTQINITFTSSYRQFFTVAAVDLYFGDSAVVPVLQVWQRDILTQVLWSPRFISTAEANLRTFRPKKRAI